MQDRELLELAAKAYGHQCYRVHEQYGFQVLQKPKPNPLLVGAKYTKKRWDCWNPLQDDGDVARLEAYLKLNVEWCGSFVLVTDSESSIECSEHYISHDDDQAARRTASVRVAAEIQRAKEDP